VSERHDEAIEELRELLSDIRVAAEDTHYGFFLGGDPNDFAPDPEASTEEERVRHKEACVAWPKVLHPAPHCTLGGTLAAAAPGFGFGTTVISDPRAEDWAERLERCIDRLERNEP